MGDVIQFTRTGRQFQTASRQLGELRRGAVANAALLRQAQHHLQSAENYGLRVLAKLDRCQALLDWTDRFCTQCLAATDLEDVEEMVRQRDALVAARHQQATAEGAGNIVRIASRR